MAGILGRFRNSWRNSVPYTENYGRDVIQEWVTSIAGSKRHPFCLDVGCGDGQDLAIVKKIIPDAMLYGLDISEVNSASVGQLGIHLRKANLEAEKIDFADETFDLVIANQVFEHLKSWVFVLSEIARVLKPGGYLIIGVPNLASLHNRIMLLFGKQPTCIHTAGMHVRGFTYPGLATVVEFNHVFKIRDCQGRVFFPFPRKIGLLMSRLWPKASSSLFVLAERCGKPSDLHQLESMRKSDEFNVAVTCESARLSR